MGASWHGGDGGWPPGGLGAWGGMSRAMGLPLSIHTWPAELLALRVHVSCCPPGGFPGGLSLCRIRIGVGPGCLPQGACHPPHQASCLPETAPAAQPPVSPHRHHRTGCPELSPVSSRAGRKGVWVWPGGAAAPGAQAPEEGKTGRDRSLRPPPPTPTCFECRYPGASALTVAPGGQVRMLQDPRR